jgi:hypothetical protein
MAPAGASQGWTGTVTAPSGTYVTSWARRSFIENNALYGWTWESGTATSTTPSVVAELASATGNFRTIGSIYSGSTLIGNSTGPYGKTEATLNVNSAVTVTTNTSSNTFTIGTGTYFVSNGNVGVGNTTPADKLVVAGNIMPSGDNSYNLGSASLRWANVYTGDLHLSNERTRGNDIDGTTGNWTIQEGESELYIINNKNGKKFKFKLEEMQ